MLWYNNYYTCIQGTKGFSPFPSKQDVYDWASLCLCSNVTVLWHSQIHTYPYIGKQNSFQCFVHFLCHNDKHILDCMHAFLDCQQLTEKSFSANDQASASLTQWTDTFGGAVSRMRTAALLILLLHTVFAVFASSKWPILLNMFCLWCGKWE